MQLYDVLLGIDHAARDTHRRVRMRVLSQDRLSAAIEAEKLADRQVKEPGIEYSHAMKVWPVLKMKGAIRRRSFTPLAA
jgi:hypothetical protein